MRKVLPILMTITVALLGCTTNRTPGNGQPVTTSPSISPADTYGSSSGNVPMTSSYLVAPLNSRADRAAYAADVMRQHQLYQPRFLGYLNPEPRLTQQPVQNYVTGQFINPSLTANPEITVNSSISSQPNPVITGGPAAALSVDGGFVLPGGSATGATTATGTAITAPLTTAGANTGTGVARILTPTMSSGATPSPLTVSGAVTPMASASTGVVTMTTPLTQTSTLNTNITAPLTVTTSPTGQVMITNVRMGTGRP